jgi:hypothetical protein
VRNAICVEVGCALLSAKDTKVLEQCIVREMRIEHRAVVLDEQSRMEQQAPYCEHAYPSAKQRLHPRGIAILTIEGTSAIWLQCDELSSEPHLGNGCPKSTSA